MREYVPPQLNKNAFHCPHCGVYAHQAWYLAVMRQPGTSSSGREIDGLWVAVCTHCGEYSLWVSDTMVYPDASPVPMPNPDMPEDVLQDYREARAIVAKSPRGAAALLRLAIEKLCRHLLGEGCGSLNDCIGELVKTKGLRKEVQQALDVVRVVGNNAVHPGQMDVRDDRDTASALFDLVNLVVEQTITEPRKVQKLYERLPESAREQIEERNGNP